ncbi:MAG: hypothetical protein KC635_04840 [Myxococcales bacterium]|nr:hypothetical protein [Myxococcales bacterium]MCB9732448.1 hypothetical protein [Deltaproteobacteria bacterium]
MRPTVASMLASLALVTLTAAAALADPPDPGDPKAPTRAQVVAGFVADCRASFEMPRDMDGTVELAPECDAYDYYQNCSPDVFGCGYEECRAGCTPACDTCQAACGGGCDGCKAKCKAGDGACVTKCAEARADCRDRCLAAATTCRDTTCVEKEKTCGAAKRERFMKECDAKRCNAFTGCVATRKSDDYDGTLARCIKKAGFKDDFCAGICEMGWDMIDMFAREARKPADEALGAACTDAKACPEGYAAVAPYLDAFCKGSLSDDDVLSLSIIARDGDASRRAVSLVYNAHGALYGYTFKTETWMNGFFYTGGAWLPASCKAKIKSVKAARDVPIAMTKLRDKVKAMWDALPKEK